MGAEPVDDFADLRLLEDQLDDLVVHSLDELGALLFDQVVSEVAHVEVVRVLATLIEMVPHQEVVVVEQGSEALVDVAEHRIENVALNVLQRVARVILVQYGVKLLVDGLREQIVEDLLVLGIEHVGVAPQNLETANHLLVSALLELTVVRKSVEVCVQELLEEVLRLREPLLEGADDVGLHDLLLHLGDASADELDAFHVALLADQTADLVTEDVVRVLLDHLSQ